MIKLLRTDAKNLDFIKLVKALDADLALSDGDEHAFYNQYNGIDMIKYAIVAYYNEVAVACGAIKQFSDSAMEVKRMFTAEQMRGKGCATTVLAGLEEWAAELGYKACVLETGKKQPKAIALYHKCGYSVIENYGQYAGVDNSVCFEKELG